MEARDSGPRPSKACLLLGGKSPQEEREAELQLQLPSVEYQSRLFAKRTLQSSRTFRSGEELERDFVKVSVAPGRSTP